MANTFVTEQEVKNKAGANASSVATASGAMIEDYITQAESFINVTASYNFTDNYAALNGDVKQVLKEIAGNIAAMYIIEYDLSGFSSTDRAQTMIDVLNQRAQEGLRLLKEKPKTKFIRSS